MFERVIAQTIQKITAETLQERSLIPLVDILQDPRIPASIKPFFETEVHWWLYNDHLARAANKRFDYENPELSSLLNYLEQVQFRHARFEREEFISVLDSAVKLIYNYLCRPQTTLKWYIFRGQPVKPLNEVMLRFGAFIDYEYFRTVFIEWVERKRAERPTFDAISATEFERVIRRTDDQILLNCTVEDLLEMMTPLFEFIGEGPEQKLPVDALVIFFDDKNIKKLVDQLEGYRDRGGGDVGRDDFVSLLDELLSTAEEGPEADFSSVYQNDELDDVVRQHLQSGQRAATPLDQQEELSWQEPPHEEMPHPAPPEPPRSEPSAPAEPVWTIGKADDNVPPVAESQPSVEQTMDGHAAGADERTGGGAFYPEQPERIYGVEEDDDEDYSDTDELVSVPSGPGVPDGAEEREGGFGQGDRGEPERADLFDDDDEDDELIQPAAQAPGRESNGFQWKRPEAWDGPPPHGAPSPVKLPEPIPATPTRTAQGEPGAARSMPVVTGTGPGASEPGGSVPAAAAPPASASAPDDVVSPSAMPEPQPMPFGRPMSDVRRFIDPSLERKVVKKIFVKNRTEYEAALDRLNGAPNWKVASQVLDELFIRYNVDPYSRTAIRFTDSVYGRYLP